MTGQRISHYIIVERVGEGGMGQVYKARDLKLDRHVALKFLNKELLSDGEARRRFVNEAKAVSSLDHPNIATIYEIDEVDESIFISMSLCEGQTLRDVLKTRQLTIDEICCIGVQIAEGLAAAHSTGIVHRDIKPANIMLLENNSVKILDFGLAKIMKLPDLTAQHTILGTAIYMSPEQIRGETVDHRSDIFSFGALLYEMATGTQPFKGEYGAAISYAIVHEEPESAVDVRPELPPELDRIISKAIAKSPEERYQDVQEIARDLEGLAACKELKKTGQGRTRGSVRPKQFLGIVAGAVLLALIFLYMFLWPNALVRHEVVTTVAVMPFKYEGADEEWQWRGAAVAELINSGLAQYASIRPVSHEQRVGAQQKMGLSGDTISEESGIEIARRCNAKTLVQGSLHQSGHRIRVDARVLDAASGALLARLNPVEGTEQQLFAIATSLTTQLIQVFEVPGGRNNSNVKNASEPSLEALRYFLEGRDAADDFRYQESIAKLEKAIELHPAYIVKAYRYLAWNYNEIGDTKKAKKVLAKERKYINRLSYRSTAFVDRLEFLADEAMYDQRWNDYAAYQEKILEEKPFDAHAQYRYGWVQYQKFRQFDSGIRALQKAIQLDSTEGSFYNMLGYAYLESGDKEQALKAINMYATFDPTDLNPLDSKAEIQIFVGDYDAAITTCERILAMQPDFQHSRLHLALAYALKGEQSRALSELEKVKNAPISSTFASDARTAGAKIYYNTGDLAQALSYVEKALALDAENVEALWLKGLISLGQSERKDTAELLAGLEQALALHGGLDNRWYLHNLQGELALENGTYSAATRFFQKAVDLGPPDRDFHLERLGYAYERMNQFKISLKHYQAALEFNPNCVAALYGLGRTLEKLGKPVEAKVNYERSYKIWENWEKRPEVFTILAQKINQVNLTHKTR